MKKWYLSKTLWVNVLSLTALVLQSVYGKAIITPEVQVTILSLVNILLRTVTTQKISK